jgi:hypothetical protein
VYVSKVEGRVVSRPSVKRESRRGRDDDGGDAIFEVWFWW